MNKIVFLPLWNANCVSCEVDKWKQIESTATLISISILLGLFYSCFTDGVPEVSTYNV